MRRNIILLLLAISMGAMCSATVRAQTPPPGKSSSLAANASQAALVAGQISLSQALERAAKSHPLTRQASATVAEAAARLRSARAIQNPTLSVAHWTGNGTGGLDEDIILTQIVELGGKRTYRTRAASAELTAAQYEQIGTALDLRLSVQTAYYEAQRAQQEYDLAAASMDMTRKFSDAAQTQYQAGDAPRSNVVRSEIELARAQQALTAAQTQRDNRLAALCSLIGQPEGASISLSDKLCYVPAPCALQALEAQALQSRPDIKAAEATRASLVAAVQSARAESRPDLFVEGRRASIDPSVEGTSLRAGVIFSPWDYGRRKADVAAAQDAVNQQDARIAEVRRSASLEVETDFRNLRQAQSVVESFQNGRLERAKELLDMAQTGYEKGASTYLEVLDAQNVYKNEQTDYARALADYDVALATLERAVGGRLP